MVDGPPRALVELARRDLYMMGEDKRRRRKMMMIDQMVLLFCSIDYSEAQIVKDVANSVIGWAG